MAHPIESIMDTTMENLRDMVDVNTVVGDAVQTPDGDTIIPISKVSFGFAAGGGEYGSERKRGETLPENGQPPFAGGAGAGISVCPLGFLVVQKGQVKLLPAQHESYLDRLVELIPNLLEEAKGLLRASKEKEEEEQDGGEWL